MHDLLDWRGNHRGLAAITGKPAVRGGRPAPDGAKNDTILVVGGEAAMAPGKIIERLEKQGYRVVHWPSEERRYVIPATLPPRTKLVILIRTLLGHHKRAAVVAMVREADIPFVEVPHKLAHAISLLTLAGINLE